MNKTQFSVREAAERVGVSRQTMFRHIKDGKVSATTDKTGQKQIELTELLRAFGELQPPETKTAPVTDSQRLTRNSTATHRDNPLLQIELVRLQAQLETKTAELEMARERINELKAAAHSTGEEKNRLLEIIERQTLLLAAPPAPQLVKRAPRTAKAKPPATTARPAAPAPKSAPRTASKPARSAPATTTTKKAAAPAPKKRAAPAAKPVPKPATKKTTARTAVTRSTRTTKATTKTTSKRPAR